MKLLEKNDEEICECGSGKYFRDCCKGKIFSLTKEEVDKIKIKKVCSNNDPIIDEKELIKMFGQFKGIINKASKNSEIRKCIHPQNDECEGKIVNAHSIQNNGILKKISLNGMVYIYNRDINSIFTSIKKEHINRATVFAGFCKKHDDTVFEPIEKNNKYIKSKEQNFVLSYRSFAFSTHKKREEFLLYRNIEKQINNELNEDKKHIKIAMQDYEEYKKMYDDGLRNSKYDNIQSKCFEFLGEAKFATSVFFQIEYDLKKEHINDLNNESITPKPLTLNIFPSNGKTYILFGYFKENKEFFQEFFDSLKTLNNKEFFTVLNNIIAFYCENFVIGPEVWEEFKENEKQNFKYKYDMSSKLKTNLLDICMFNFFLMLDNSEEKKYIYETI